MMPPDDLEWLDRLAAAITAAEAGPDAHELGIVQVMPDEALIRGYTRLHRKDVVQVVTALRTAILHRYGERFDD